MKALANVSKSVSVGIWDSESLDIRVHADRTLIREPFVNWVNNSGSLKYKNMRVTGWQHKKFLAAIAMATEDDVSPDDYIMDVYHNLSEACDI